jgi:hypothetical protein
MENPIKKFFEKPRKQSDSLELSDEEASQLMLDLDKVWLSDDMPEGGYMLLQTLRQLPETDAARTLSSLLMPHLHLDLKQRIISTGIGVGELTPNISMPSGVHGMLRSDHPILLIANNSPEDYNRPLEIACEIGKMIYGRNNEAILKFVKAFDLGLTLSEDFRPKAIE